MPPAANAIWQKFRAQPPGIRLLLLAALMIWVVMLLTPDDRAGVNMTEPAAPDVVFNREQPVLPPPAQTAVVVTANSTGQAAEPLMQPAETDTAQTDETASGLDQQPAAVPQTNPQPAARLVLIIDDIGYNAEAGRRAINLPGQLTYAVIPFTPHGKMLANSAFAANKEVMLHAPMSNLSGMDLGPGGLTLRQNEQEFLQTLQAALADIPHIKGVNNHTGSELTAAQQPMQWVMQELRSRGLYFVDSVTTSASVAAATAEQFQVPSLRRHVFLDNVQTADAIDFEFRRALALAQKQGFAVAIGHPYPETLAYLEQALPLLSQQNVSLISASAMIAQLQDDKPPATVPVETTAAW